MPVVPLYYDPSDNDSNSDGGTPRSDTAQADGTSALPDFPAPSAWPTAGTSASASIENTAGTVNVDHVELVVHMISNTDIMGLASGPGDDFNFIVASMKAGLQTPYLLYALLAFSARHLEHLASVDAGAGNNININYSASNTQPFSAATSPMSFATYASTPPPPPPPSQQSSSIGGPLRPQSSAAHYQRLAVVLQTRAVSLFNASWQSFHGVFDQANCVPMLLFSSALSHHLLVDSLEPAKQHGGGGRGSGAPGSSSSRAFDTFIKHYVQCAFLQGGMYTIAMAAWPMLLASELGHILQWSARFTSRSGRGNHCSQLLALIEQAPSADFAPRDPGSAWLQRQPPQSRLTHTEKDACRHAVRLLQVALDVLFLPPEVTSTDGANQGPAEAGTASSDAWFTAAAATPAQVAEIEKRYQHKMIVLWPALIPKAYVDLLAAKAPEALVILVYYAWVLQHGRHYWQVGDAGVCILRLVSDYLGPTWDDYLDYPRRQIEAAGEDQGVL